MSNLHRQVISTDKISTKYKLFVVYFQKIQGARFFSHFLNHCTMKQGRHTALTTPEYGTQPLHWHQTQKRHWRWKKCPKRAKMCLKMHKKCYYLHKSRELVSPVCLSYSCLQADCCLQWRRSNSDKPLSCQQLEIKPRFFLCGQISWNLLWPLRIMIYYFPESPGGPKYTF